MSVTFSILLSDGVVGSRPGWWWRGVARTEGELDVVVVTVSALPATSVNDHAAQPREQNREDQAEIYARGLVTSSAGGPALALLCCVYYCQPHSSVRHLVQRSYVCVEASHKDCKEASGLQVFPMHARV